jgi:hypothetical protein
MAQIELTQTHMVIKLTQSEKIWSMHGDFKIPAALIRGAEVADKEVWKTLGLRLPGTALPTYLAYGSYLRFGKTGGWTFALWRSTHPALTITLVTAPGTKGTGQRYKRLIIATDNAQALADKINDAIVAC